MASKVVIREGARFIIKGSSARQAVIRNEQSVFKIGTVGASGGGSFQALDWKQSARVATTANIALTGLLTIDGVTLAADDRVLVKDQIDATQNGIYDAAAGAWARSDDANTSSRLNNGAVLYIGEGDTNAEKLYVVTSPDPTLGTDDIDWELLAPSTLSDAAPLALGTASAGVGLQGSRYDHVHAHGNQLGGTLHAVVTGASAGFMSAADKTSFDAISSTYALQATTFTAGAGLSGGGTLAASRTFDVVANADGSIVVNADDVQVGVLASDAQHGVRGGGTQHAVVIAGVSAGFMSAADKTKLDGIGAGANVISVFSRTGAVVAASNDYTWAQINKATSDIADITTRSHTSLTSIGTNTHAAIDTHIADGTIHFTVASIDHGSIAGLGDDDHTQYLLLAGRAAACQFIVKQVSARASGAAANTEAWGEGAVAAGIRGNAFGRSASAAGVDSFAAGYNASAGFTNSTAIGSGASCTNVDSIAIGKGSTASQDSATTIGVTATASVVNGTAIGWGAQAITNSGGTAIGANSTASGNSAVAIGPTSLASGTDAICIRGTRASGDQSIGIGRSTDVTVTQGIAIGSTATATTGVSNIAFGFGSQATGATACIAIGASTVASIDNGIALGSSSNASVTAGNIAIGTGATASMSTSAGIFIKSGTTARVVSGANAVVIGLPGATVTGTGVVAIGGTLTLGTGINNIVAIGHTANANGVAGAIAIGFNAQATGATTASIAIGSGATANSAAGIALGTSAVGRDGIGIGASVTVSAGTCIAIGHSAFVQGSDSVVIGLSSGVTGGTTSDCVIVGSNGSIASGGAGSIVLGRSGSVAAPNSIVIGLSATISGSGSSGSLAIGTSATVSAANTIFISTLGSARTVSGTTNVIIGGPAATVSGTGVVAIGATLTLGAVNNVVAVGHSSTANAAGAIAVGKSSIASGASSIAIGLSATTSTFTNALAIGDSATCGANNEAQLGTSAQPFNIQQWGSISLASVSPGIIAHNQTDQVTNFEKATLDWVSNVYTLQIAKGGTGTGRELQLLNSTGNGLGTVNGGVQLIGAAASFGTFQVQSDTVSMRLSGKLTTAARANVQLSNGASGAAYSASSGNQMGLQVLSTITHTGSAGFIGIDSDITETSTGSGARYFFRGILASTTEKFSVNTAGLVVAVSDIVGSQHRATGDTGGTASQTTFTNGENTGTGRSTGVGTIKFADVTARDNAGFIKIYIGTTAYYVPVFAAN